MVECDPEWPRAVSIQLALIIGIVALIPVGFLVRKRFRDAPHPFPVDIAGQYDLNEVGRRYLAFRAEHKGREDGRSSSRFILSHLSAGADRALVDVGCGGGDELVAYRDLGFATAQGVECSEVMAAAARQRLGDASAIHAGSWSSIPFADDSQDYLVGRASLHYEEDLDQAYREAARVLKPGGMLIVVVGHPDNTANRGTVSRGGRRYVQLKLFQDRVPVTYPLHTVDDYLSPTFAEHFELVERQDIGQTKPNKLAIAARTR